MKYLDAISRLLFIICLPLMIITAIIAASTNCPWIYTHGFEKYNVRQSLADNGIYLTANGMDEIARDFIRYFNSRETYIDITVQQNGTSAPLFNAEEKEHFKDVKKLFRLDYYVAFGLFIYCLLHAFVRRKGESWIELGWSVLFGSGLTLCLMLLLGIGVLLDFDSLFLQFHILSFSNDFWSAEGNMLLLFPGGFWYDVVVYCAITISSISLLLLGASCAFVIYHRKKEKDLSIEA